MVHQKILSDLKQDLDDLEIRNPRKYRENEIKLRRLEAKANFDVSQSPIGIRQMEKEK